jgi:hypothetical protein
VGPPLDEPLSDTERRILAALCEPYTRTEPERVPAANKSIADELFISVETVRTNLRLLYIRFGMGAETDLSPAQKRHRLAEIALTLDLTDGDAATGSAAPPARDAKAAGPPGAEPDSSPAAAVPAAGREHPVPRGRRGRRRIASAVAGAVAIVALGAVVATVLSAGEDRPSPGTHAQATAGTPAPVAANVLVLLDMSATMQRPLDANAPRGDTRMQTATQFVASGVANAHEHDRLGVWLFGGSGTRVSRECRGRLRTCELQPVAPATKAIRTRLPRRLLGLRGGGSDAPPYAVVGRAVQALRALRPPRSTVSSVLVITDGGAQATLSGVSELAAARRSDHIQVLLVTTGAKHLCDGVLERAIRARFQGACYEVSTVPQAEAARDAILPKLRAQPSAQVREAAATTAANTATTTARPTRPGGAGRSATRSGRCPNGRIRVPNVIGKVHQLAQDTMQAAGLILLRERDATGRGRRLIFDRDWRTVRQRPSAGSCVAADTVVVLYARMIRE